MAVNKWKDLAERVVWTAIQAFAATALVTGFDDWALTLQVAGASAAIAACKVVVAQNVGDRGDGAAIPGGVTR